MVIRIKKMRARKTPPKNPSPRKVKQKMTKGNNSKKLNLLNDIEVRDTKPGLVNYCIPGVLSFCGAGTNWEAQKKCKFAEKSLAINVCTTLKALTVIAIVLRPRANKEIKKDP